MKKEVGTGQAVPLIINGQRAELSIRIKESLRTQEACMTGNHIDHAPVFGQQCMIRNSSVVQGGSPTGLGSAESEQSQHECHGLP